VVTSTGFGFLSENAEFSRSVEQAGLIFIGPSAHSISCMGSKIEAKRLLTQPEYVKVVPVIPGYNGVAQDDDTLVAEAIKIGYPVLLKASAGGGGKGNFGIKLDFPHFVSGMRVCLET
jgi:acetyl/propionyl-CoA carboxylase alpha subunit